MDCALINGVQRISIHTNFCKSAPFPLDFGSSYPIPKPDILHPSFFSLPTALHPPPPSTSSFSSQPNSGQETKTKDKIVCGGGRVNVSAMYSISPFR